MSSSNWVAIWEENIEQILEWMRKNPDTDDPLEEQEEYESNDSR
jgi:hypothetical protein